METSTRTRDVKLGVARLLVEKHVTPANIRTEMLRIIIGLGFEWDMTDQRWIKSEPPEDKALQELQLKLNSLYSLFFLLSGTSLRS